MADHWYVKVMGEVIGPLSPLRLGDMVRNGSVNEMDWVRFGKDGKWVSAESVDRLFEARESGTGKTESENNITCSYVQVMGETVGPMTPSQLGNMVRDGSLTELDLGAKGSERRVGFG